MATVFCPPSTLFVLCFFRAFKQTKRNSKMSDSPVEKKVPKFGGSQEKCDICTKTVYPMEKITAEGKIWHKNCLKCAKCDKILSLGTYAAAGDKMYCKPHFKELFKLKGNYDEGFGGETHAKKWAAGEKPASEEAAQ
eukprot:comp18534_c0_seq1/m.19966 comp18534_c0_seq1/g.19966  ORF comp18534_c0_seq1/g.19966 comp18534_c0_seq1/m.19966 type:complete len:137 (-) comp18534_c0_seq1:233-643(-)